MKTGENSEAFYRIPKFLFGDEYGNILSTDAKLLYALLLDRAGLSAKNGWFAQDGRVFLYFTVAEASQVMKMNKNKITRLFRELESAGLIERKNRGLCKCAVIYLKKETSSFHNNKHGTPQNEDSGVQKKWIPEAENSSGNNNEYNNNYINNNNLSIGDDRYDEIRCRVEEQLDYDYLCSVRDKTAVDEIITVICDTLYSKAEKVRVGGELMSKGVVDSRLLKLDCEHICYVTDSFDANTSDVRNIRSYMLTALYNAPATCDHYYRAQVNRDLYGKDNS